MIDSVCVCVCVIIVNIIIDIVYDIIAHVHVCVNVTGKVEDQEHSIDDKDTGIPHGHVALLQPHIHRHVYKTRVHRNTQDTWSTERHVDTPKRQHTHGHIVPS